MTAPAKPTATLHMFCGKVAAGKSTLAARLAKAPRTLLMTEDALVAGLYGDQITTGQDFMACSAKLRATLAPYIAAVLQAGVSVVLDFQANTKESRAWMRSILDTAQADHILHVLTPPDEVCIARMKARNASGTHPFEVTEAHFHQFAKYFDPPAPDEGWQVKLYTETPTVKG